MTEPKMQKGRGEGVALHLAVWEGQGSPVLCVHGLTANCRSFDWVAQGLAPTHRVIAFDLRGRGLSDKPDAGYSVEQHGRDIATLLDHLGLERAHLIGHSLGAGVVAVFAARYPDRIDKAVLIDGAGKLNKRQTAQVLRGIAPSLSRLDKRYASQSAYEAAMAHSPYFTPWNRTIEAYFRHEMEPFEGGVRTRARAAHIAEELGNLVAIDVRPIYRQIRCPTLILRAGQGLTGPGGVLLPGSALARMVAGIRQAWLVNLERENHYSIVFQKNPVRDRAILNFLASE